MINGIYSRSINKAEVETLNGFEAGFNKENYLDNLTEHEKKMLLKKILVKNLKSLYDMDYDAENEQKDVFKRGFLSEHHKIKIYYNVMRLQDGTVILVPKDTNKNHYFIG